MFFFLWDWGTVNFENNKTKLEILCCTVNKQSKIASFLNVTRKIIKKIKMSTNLFLILHYCELYCIVTIKI